MTGIRRVIVGVSGSPASLRALRYAEELAHANDALLIPVLAWIPPGGELADRRAPCAYLRRVWADDADRRLNEALSMVLGEIPAGPLPVRPLVQRGEAGIVLVNTACYPDDLLVLGAGAEARLADMDVLAPAPDPGPGPPGPRHVTRAQADMAPRPPGITPGPTSRRA